MCKGSPPRSLCLRDRSALLVLGAPAGPGTGRPSRRTGRGSSRSTPPSSKGIVANFPRVTRVSLNPLGFERINAIRAAKGRPCLDPSAGSPVGGRSREGPWPAAGRPSASPEATVKRAPAICRSASTTACCASSRLSGPGQSRTPAPASPRPTYQLSHMTALQRNLDIRNDGRQHQQVLAEMDLQHDQRRRGQRFEPLRELHDHPERHGAATWAEFPYNSNYRAWSLNGTVWRNALGARTRTIQYVSDRPRDAGLAQLKALLADGYVLVFGTYINSWVFNDGRRRHLDHGRRRRPSASMWPII